MSARTVHKTVRVHPPEADTISCAFGQARAASETILARLNTLHAILDQEWEGNQKRIFQEDWESSIERFSKILLPQLRFWEMKYRNFTVDKLIDIVQQH
jgi:uncharacterized protein YukE